MPPQKITALKEGERIVYPAHGVGVVENVEKVKNNGSSIIYYTIRINETGMTIRVSCDNACKIGIRPVINSREVPKLLRLLKSKHDYDNGLNWHKRQKNYLDRIKSGSIFELVSVLGELNSIQSRKELSFGEQRMYENVRQLVAMEIAEAKGIQMVQANKLLDKAAVA